MNVIVKNSIGFVLLISGLTTCAQNKTSNNNQDTVKLKSCCTSKLPSRFGGVNLNKIIPQNTTAPTRKNREGMVWINGGTYMMGGDDEQARKDEFPKHKVSIKGFYMDETEVTNAQFGAFVKATHYVTTAEKNINWDDMKKQLPVGTAKPSADMLKAASLVFVPTKGEVNLQDYSQWWQWVHGASWLHPQGSNSNIVGKEKYPVVHISWDDAVAYCRWAKKRLPTEAEWEFAARGGKVNTIYSWGNIKPDTDNYPCNYWQGNFPYKNDAKDGFIGAAPVKSFASNGYGLYDMAGNVWEWCADLYNNNYYNQFLNVAVANNPKGPLKSFDPDEPKVTKRVMRGGSFLCSDSYCSGYRCAARMKSSPDSGMEHLGFRCVVDN